MKQSEQKSADGLTKKLEHDGYVVFKNAFPKSLIEALNQQLAPSFENYPNSQGFFCGDKTIRFGSIFAKSTTSHNLATHPVILDIMEGIMKPYCDCIQINLTQAIGIHPGERAQLAHRDDEMFPFPHPDVPFMINCMWALTPFNKDNGGTRIWPQSQHGNIDRELEEDSALSPELDVGDVLIYLGSTLHCGGANRSGNTRQGLVISYSQGWLRQAENQYLANPPHIAKHYPKKLQDLVGYRAHRPNLGWYEGQDPSIALTQSAGYLPTKDLLPPHLEAMVKNLTRGEAA